MGSTRLPGKVLRRLGNKQVLSHVILRLKRADVFDDIVVATTDRPCDDVIVELAVKEGAGVFRGSEDDVLERYVGAAEKFRAQAIVRITADCPLIDPYLVSRMVTRFTNTRSSAIDVDLITNCRIRTYPRGLDTEIFTREALILCGNQATSAYHREHVTTYMYDNPSTFTILDHVSDSDLSRYRLTLDAVEDFELMRRIFEAWNGKDDVSLGLNEVIDLMEKNPEWTSINSHVIQKTR